MTARDWLLLAICAGIGWWIYRDHKRAERERRWVDGGIAAFEHLLAHEAQEGWR